MTRDDYLQAASSAAELIGDPAVAAGWNRPSALAEFGVSGLAGHLARQVFSVPDVLGARLPGEARISVLEHYERSAWRGASIDDEINVGVRKSGEDLAAPGAATLAAQVSETVAELRSVLAAEPADRVVYLPWTSWSLTLDGFLLTRMMEIVVHMDDLAVSVGIDTPAVSEAATESVVDLLSRLAIGRHGAVPVIRALSRAERAPETIAAI